MPDDRELLAALRNRTPRAFQQLFDMYSDKMFGLAVGILRNEEEAEDVVQDAFLRFFENLEDFEGRSKIGTWLYRTVHNASVDRLRRSKPELELSDIGNDWDDSPVMPSIFLDWSTAPEKLLSTSETEAQLQAAVANLSKSLRSVFLLRDVHEFSTRETAEILEITPGAVKVRLHRARLQLREQLSHYFAERV